jgi:DNA-binding winged helix-turn-helix (wHTH) protein
MPFRFADCELDPVARELRRGGTRVPVQPKVFELLAHLARNGDRLVPREEILRVLWPGVSVTSASVSRAIKGARSAIGDDGHSQRLLQTTKKGGVRFVCPVEVDGEDHAAALDRECEARALLALAQDRRRTGHADAADPARRAMGLARAQGLRRTFAEAALVFAGIFDRHRPPDPGLVSALEEALGLLHPDDQDLRARLLARLAAEESFAADGARRESVQREAVALARALGDVGLEVDVVATPFSDLWERLSLAEQRSLARRAGEQAARTHDRALHVRALHLHGRELLSAGAPLAELDAVLNVTAREAAATEDLYVTYATALDRATHALLAGDPERSEALARAAFELRPVAFEGGALFLLTQLLMTFLARQRFGEILPLLEADAARRPGPSSRCLLACVLAEAGEVERCRAVLATVVVQDLASLARFGSAPANAAVLARACFVAGCTEPVPVLEAILAPYRDRIVLRGLITAHGPGARFLALLAALRGDRGSAHALLAEARALATRAGVSRWLSELGDDERVI